MAASANNPNRGGTSWPERGQVRAKAARGWQTIREAGKFVFLAGVWVAVVLGLAWAFSYGMCYLAGRDDLLKLIGGVAGGIVFIFLLVVVIKFTDIRRLPRYFFVLGVSLIALTLLARSIPDEPIFQTWGLGGIRNEAGEKIIECRGNMMNTWFGDLGFVGGLGAAMFGAAWQLWEQQKKEREKREQTRGEIKKLGISIAQEPNQIQAAQKWSVLKKVSEKRADNETIRILHDELDIIRRQHLGAWTQAILVDIDWRFFRGVKLEGVPELIELLIVLHEQYNEESKIEKKKDGHQSLWKNIKELVQLIDPFTETTPQPNAYNENPVESQEQYLDTVFRIWEEYDIMVREWVVALISGWIKALPDERQKEEFQKKVESRIGNIYNNRRLVRHPKMQALLSDRHLAVKPTYQLRSPWFESTTYPEGKGDKIQLDDRKVINPFGKARAEWEADISRFYYRKPEVMELMDASSMAWIIAPSGSGRTALARYTYHNLEKPMSGVFPLYMSLHISQQTSIRRFLLEQLLHKLVDAWGSVFRQTDARNPDGANGSSTPFNGPIAFLDLDYHEQLKVAQLLFWEMGSLEAIWAWLISLRLGLVQSKEGRTLKARLEFLLQHPPPQRLPEGWMLNLVSARPSGLVSTYTMLELDDIDTKTHSLGVAKLASDLQRQRIYLKIITAQSSPKVYPNERLTWTRNDLYAMLSQRDHDDRILTNGAKTALSDFVYKEANGLPREMMRLGNMALKLRSMKKETRSLEAEGVLTQRDIEEAIELWREEQSRDVRP